MSKGAERPRARDRKKFETTYGEPLPAAFADDDMRQLFAHIPLADVTTSMTINATAPILLSLYVAAGDAQGTPAEKLGGTTQNDILKEYIARGTYIYPPRPSMRLATDLIAY